MNRPTTQRHKNLTKKRFRPISHQRKFRHRSTFGAILLQRPTHLELTQRWSIVVASIHIVLRSLRHDVLHTTVVRAVDSNTCMQPHEQSELITYLNSITNRADVVLADTYPINDLEFWVIGLDQWGRRISVCAAIAAARSVLDVWERYFPNRPEVANAIAIAEYWLESPESVTTDDAKMRSEAASDATHEYCKWDQGLEGSAGSASACAASAIYDDPSSAYVAARAASDVRQCQGNKQPLDTVYRDIRKAILQLIWCNGRTTI